MTLQQQFGAAFEAFIVDSAEDAIISSTQAGYGGSGYSVELFDDGTFRVLWNNEIGNLYESPGLILGIPQLDTDEMNNDEPALSYFDSAIASLRERFDTLDEEY